MRRGEEEGEGGEKGRNTVYKIYVPNITRCTVHYSTCLLNR